MPPTYIIIYRTSTIYEQQSVNTQLWHLMAITDLTTLSQRTILSQWRIRGGGSASQSQSHKFATSIACSKHKCWVSRGLYHGALLRDQGLWRLCNNERKGVSWLRLVFCNLNHRASIEYEVPRWQPQHHSGLATLHSVGAVP